MSATGRIKADGTRTPRREKDFYPTPAWVVAPIVDHLLRTKGPDVSDWLPHVTIDPFAGDGAILSVARGWLGYVEGIEIDPVRARQCVEAGISCVVGDSVTDLSYLTRCRWIVTNPPYSHATPWLYALLEARARMPIAPVVAALLPLPFLESGKRIALNLDHPAHVIVCPYRVSYTGDGKTDSTASAWFVWGDGREGQWSLLKAVRPETQRSKA